MTVALTSYLRSFFEAQELDIKLFNVLNALILLAALALIGIAAAGISCGSLAGREYDALLVLESHSW